MRRSNTKEFIKKAHIKHGDKYDYSKVCYIKACDKVKIGCSEHGYWEQRPNDHLQGNGCPACKFDRISAMKRCSVQTFIKKAQEIHGEYNYSKVQYVNAITKVEIICKEHGPFFQTPDKHTSGKTRCPRCSNLTSRGEKVIEGYLDSRNIQYEREKRFSDLTGLTPNSRLRYDFFLPKYNLLIEYDGEHHFRPIRTKGRLSEDQASYKYTRTKINDKKKNLYAKQHGLDLVRISYNDDILKCLEKIKL